MVLNKVRFARMVQSILRVKAKGMSDIRGFVRENIKNHEYLFFHFKSMFNFMTIRHRNPNKIH